MPRPYGIFPLDEDLWRNLFPFATYEGAMAPVTIWDMLKEMLFHILFFLGSMGRLKLGQTCKTFRDYALEYSQLQDLARTHRASNVSAGIYHDTPDPVLYDVLRYGQRSIIAPKLKIYPSPVLRVTVSSCKEFITVLLADMTLHVYSFCRRSRMYALDCAFFNVVAWQQPVPYIFYFPNVHCYTMCPVEDRRKRGVEHTRIVSPFGAFRLLLEGPLRRPEAYRFGCWSYRDHYFLAVREVGDTKWIQVYRYTWHDELTSDNVLSVLSTCSMWQLGISVAIRVNDYALFDMSSPRQGVYDVYMVPHDCHGRTIAFSFSYDAVLYLCLEPYGPSSSFVYRRHHQFGFVGLTSRPFHVSGGLVHTGADGLPQIGPFGPHVLPPRCFPFPRGRWINLIVGGYVWVNAENPHQLEFSVVFARLQAHL